MTAQEEIIAWCVGVAIVAYTLGAQSARVKAIAAPYDPLAWLNGYTSA